jgi:hypothetical protein
MAPYRNTAPLGTEGEFSPAKHLLIELDSKPLKRHLSTPDRQSPYNKYIHKAFL